MNNRPIRPFHFNMTKEYGVISSAPWYVPTIPTVGTVQTLTIPTTQHGYMDWKGDKIVLPTYGHTSALSVIDFSTGTGVVENNTYSGYPYAQYNGGFTSNGDVLISAIDSDNTPTLIRSFYWNGTTWALRSDDFGMASIFSVNYSKVDYNTNLLIQSMQQNIQPAFYDGSSTTFGTQKSYGSDYLYTEDVDRNTGRFLIAEYVTPVFYVVTTNGSTISDIASGSVIPELPYPNMACLRGNTIISINRNGTGIYKYVVNGSSISLAYSSSWTTSPDLPFSLWEVDTNLYLALSNGGSNRNGVANWIIDTGTSLEVSNDTTLSSAINTYNLDRFCVASHPTGGTFLHAAANLVGTLYSWPLTWS